MRALRVLVVEDDPMVGPLLAEVLEDLTGPEVLPERLKLKPEQIDALRR